MELNNSIIYIIIIIVSGDKYKYKFNGIYEQGKYSTLHVAQNIRKFKINESDINL